MAIAIEGLDSVIAALSDVKAKIESGTLTHDDMTKMWPSWDVRDFIDGAVSLLAKMDEAKKVYDEILPKVKALDESGTDGDQDGDGDTGGDGDGGDVSKSAFFSGGDVSPTTEGGAADYQSLKKGKNAYGKPSSFYS